MSVSFFSLIPSVGFYIIFLKTWGNKPKKIIGFFDQRHDADQGAHGHGTNASMDIEAK
jgi:hypothetical protein